MAIRSQKVDTNSIDPNEYTNPNDLSDQDRQIFELAVDMLKDLDELPVWPVVYRHNLEHYETVWGHQAVRAAKIAYLAKNERFSQIWVVELSGSEDKYKQQSLDLLEQLGMLNPSLTDSPKMSEGSKDLEPLIRSMNRTIRDMREDQIKAINYHSLEAQLKQISGQLNTNGSTPEAQTTTQEIFGYVKRIWERGPVGGRKDPIFSEAECAFLLKLANGSDEEILDVFGELYTPEPAQRRAKELIRVRPEEGFEKLEQVLNVLSVNKNGAKSKNKLIEKTKWKAYFKNQFLDEV